MIIFSIKEKNELCSFFKIEQKTLNYLLYRKKDNYKIFEIPKKSGGYRKIKSPKSTIKIIQKNFSNHLYKSFKNHGASHGFCLKRSIKTNAEIHINKKYIINIDLQDFFESINFGRVRGLFLSSPFLANEEIATILAQICCDENSLPQGAPTSPIISNLICLRLDKCLSKFAKSNKAKYTRYADDITFSLNDKSKIVSFIKGPNTVSDELNEIIVKNGFNVNHKKTRIDNKYTDRQKVTGLVVNEKLNLERRYIKKIRAILHFWEKYGLSEATKKFFGENKIDDIYLSTFEKRFIKSIKGKINFIKQIKGQQNFTWRKIENQYNLLMKNKKTILPISNTEIVELATWVIETKDSSGNGFCIEINKKKFIITCSHVIDGGIEKIYRPKDNKSVDFNVIVDNKDKDLAIIGMKEDNLWNLSVKDNENFREGDKIVITGYPNYSPGQGIRISESIITGKGKKFGADYIRIKDGIIEGNSGGAILNTKYEVIGMATNHEGSIFKEPAFLTINEIIKEMNN